MRENAINQIQMFSSGWKMFMSWRMNGKLCKKALQLLEDDKVCIIGVYGMGGDGKTTLVKNLNNELLKIDVSRFKLSFGVVIWITIPKPTYISKVQAKIADRLNLKVDSEGNEENNANKIYQRLKEEKSFLLILDDVWEAIDLDHVSVRCAPT